MGEKNVFINNIVIDTISGSVLAKGDWLVKCDISKNLHKHNPWWEALCPHLAGPPCRAGRSTQRRRPRHLCRGWSGASGRSWPAPPAGSAAPGTSQTWGMQGQICQVSPLHSINLLLVMPLQLLARLSSWPSWSWYWPKVSLLPAAMHTAVASNNNIW